MKQTDQNLIEAIKSGGRASEAALIDVYEKSKPAVMKFILQNKGQKNDALDVLQDAIVAFYSAVQKNSFRGESSIQTFIYAASRYNWLNKLKRQQIELNYKKSELEENKSIHYTPHYLENDKHNIIQSIFLELGEACQVLLTNVFYFNYSMKELVKILPYENEQVVRNKKYKCMKQLKTLIKNRPAILKTTARNVMNDDRLIERFLNDEMTEQERSDFQVRLESDAALQEDMALYKIAEKVLVWKGEAELKNRLATYEQHRGRSIQFKRIMWLIIGVFVLLLAAFMWFNMSNSPTHEQLFIAHYEPYPGPIQSRDKAGTDDPWERAANDYKTGNYEEAIKNFHIAQEQGVQPQYLVDYYLALSILSVDDGNLQKSIDLLQRVIDGSNNYRQPATWFLALAYIKNNEVDRAKPLLAELIKGKDTYAQESAEILRHLDNFDR